MFLKPVAGLAVPDPDRGGVLPAEGREVAMTSYWERRRADGDVVEVTDSDQSTKATVSRSKKEEA